MHGEILFLSLQPYKNPKYFIKTEHKKRRKTSASMLVKLA